MMNIIRIALDFDVINFGNFLNSGNNILCFVLSICLSKISKKAGNIVTTVNSPNRTPFAITIPISLPNNKSIVHSARKPANVVNDEPNIDLNV